MKIGCLLIICLASLVCHAQDSTTTRGTAGLAGYLQSLASNDHAYFYALYANGSFTRLSTADSVILRRFLSNPSTAEGQRAIFISRISDLDRLKHLTNSVVVYGPRFMEPYARNYVPTPEVRQPAMKPYKFLRWFGDSYINRVRYIPSCYAVGRWIVPYTLKTVEANPNSIPYYLTGTNTNKYLLSPYAIRP